MSDLHEATMVQIQNEWRQAFALLIRAAQQYARISVHRRIPGYPEFVRLSSAAIALYQLEEHYPLHPLMDVWPSEGWEKDLHQAAVAWAELSFCVPRQNEDIGYAAMSVECMRFLQRIALEAPVSGADSVLDLVNLPAGETRHGV